MRKRAIDAIVLAAGVLLLALLAYWKQSTAEAFVSSPSTYDYGGRGYAALYQLLGREGLHPQRFERAPAHVFGLHGTLVIAGGAGELLFAFGPARAQASAIGSWVREGGTVVVLGQPENRLSSALSLPPQRHATAGGAPSSCGFARAIKVEADFPFAYATRACSRQRRTLIARGGNAYGIAYGLQKGRVVAIASESVFDNAHLARAQNAALAYALFSALPPPAFDEDLYGHETANTFWGVLGEPVRAAIVLLLSVLALAIVGSNLPFAPPYRLRAAAERHTGEYIASLASMLERGRTQREMLRAICAPLFDVLAPRVAGDAQARSFKQRLEALVALPQPQAHDLLEAGKIFVQVRKEYQL